MNLMIIQIKGDTNFTINLDPGIWIFDERKFPMETKLQGVSGLGIELRPFLLNAEPKEGAHTVMIHRREGENIQLSFEEVLDSYLCFAIDGKPVREDQGGPALLYLSDGSNLDQPIRFIKTIEVVST